MIFYIPQNYDGCFYYRCLLPMRANGFHGPQQSLRSPIMSNDDMIAHAKVADIIVWQRPTEPLQLEHALYFKSKGKKIVMENDDTFKVGSGIEDVLNRFGNERIVERGEGIAKFAQIADMVTTTTEFLADEYRQLSDNVVVLPNMIDPLDWPEPKKNETDKIRIGILGSVVTSQDWVHIAPLLKELSDRDDVQLVVQGVPDKYSKHDRKYYKKEIAFWHKLNIEPHSMVPLADYMETVTNLRLDLALIPRKDNYFNRCKSNCKWLELSLLEVPVVAQSYSDGLSPYQIDTDHIYLADKLDSWRVQVNNAIKDKQGREELGRKAREYVVSNYSINKKGHLWQEAYDTLLD